MVIGTVNIAYIALQCMCCSLRSIQLSVLHLLPRYSLKRIVPCRGIKLTP